MLKFDVFALVRGVPHHYNRHTGKYHSLLNDFTGFARAAFKL